MSLRLAGTGDVEGNNCSVRIRGTTAVPIDGRLEITLTLAAIRDCSVPSLRGSLRTRRLRDRTNNPHIGR